MFFDLEAFLLIWKIKYGNTDNTWQKELSGREVRKITVVVRIGETGCFNYA